MAEDKINTITIKVRDFYNENISSRDAIALLFNRRFESEQNIIIDFSDILFITRSASHQLLKEIERVEERFKCKVEIVVPSNNEVAHMLKIVKDSLAQAVESVSENREVKQVSFSSPSELNKFLMQF